MRIDRLCAKLGLTFFALAVLYVYWLPNARYAYATFTNTTHYNLAKPAVGTPGVDWAPRINQNFDVLDQAVHNAVSNSVTLGGELSGSGSNANVVSAGGVAVSNLLNATSSAGGDCTGTLGNLTCTDIVNGIDTGEIMHTPDESVDNSIPRANGTTGKIFQNSTILIDNDGNVTGFSNITVASYEVVVQIEAGAATIGSTAPTATSIQNAVRCLAFDADAEKAFVQFEIPSDWDGTDINFEVDWNPSDQSIGASETVEWVVRYRSTAVDETVINGNEGMANTVYVDGGGGTAQYTFKETEITLPYNDSDQPLTVGDHINIGVYRNMTADTFSGDVCVTAWEYKYMSTSFSRQ